MKKEIDFKFNHDKDSLDICCGLTDKEYKKQIKIFV